MHRFLRSIGFSTYRLKQEEEKLLQDIIHNSQNRRIAELSEGIKFCEIRGEVAPGMGVAVFGELDENEIFHQKYYFPYLVSNDLSSDAECSIQRHAEKETYAGLLDEYKVGISLIFYLENLFEYRKQESEEKIKEIKNVNLTGLATSGKILFPIQKTKKQIERAKVAAKDRNNLLEAAKNGDEDAMETLTIEDIDLYSQISRRIMKEDIYTIIDSCFMPCGIECDQYAVMGEIVHIETKVNRVTEEEVYDFTLDCNDMMFHVGIAKPDLVGEPEVGRRFKGQIWMQGQVNFEA